jgi:hypothetical protein
MCNTGHLLDLAYRLRLQASETRLPNYAMRFRQAAAELEALVATSHSTDGTFRPADGRTALAAPRYLSVAIGRF